MWLSEWDWVGGRSSVRVVREPRYRGAYRRGVQVNSEGVQTKVKSAEVRPLH